MEALESVWSMPIELWPWSTRVRLVTGRRREPLEELLPRIPRKVGMKLREYLPPLIGYERCLNDHGWGIGKAGAAASRSHWGYTARMKAMLSLVRLRPFISCRVTNMPQPRCWLSSIQDRTDGRLP